MCEAAVMSGHTYTHTHTHTYTHDNYYNPRCAHAHLGLITRKCYSIGVSEGKFYVGGFVLHTNLTSSTNASNTKPPIYIELTFSLNQSFTIKNAVSYLYDAIIAHKVSYNFLETSRGTPLVEVSGLARMRMQSMYIQGSCRYN